MRIYNNKVAANEKRQGRYDVKATRSYKLIAQGLAVAQHRNVWLIGMPLPFSLMPTDFSSSSKSVFDIVPAATLPAAAATASAA